MTVVAALAWLYWRAFLLAACLALLVALATGVVVLTAMRALADATGHRTTIVLPESGTDRSCWAALSTGLGVWSLIALATE